MPEITTIHDKNSEMLPHVDKLRESQKQGGQGRGLPENDHGPLNSIQGHGVEIKS